ncbi:MAG: nitroreductase family deazaflavin-dependent oxidoreductase [Chloroflexota bacterium]
MATDLPKSRRIRATKPKRARKPSGSILRTINAKVEPRVRSGFGSPRLLFPAGLIVLQTRGRKSGQTHRTPLVATMAPGGYLWISTILGRRANWLRNAHANPNVRYWLRGKSLEGTALVSAPGYEMPDLRELPPLIRWPATRAVKAARLVGFGVVIIVPAK